MLVSAVRRRLNNFRFYFIHKIHIKFIAGNSLKFNFSHSDSDDNNKKEVEEDVEDIEDSVRETNRKILYDINVLSFTILVYNLLLIVLYEK